MRTSDQGHLEIVFARLLAQNSLLQRRLDADLARAGLDPALLELASTLLAGRDRQAVERVIRRLAAEPQPARVSWEQISRPSLDDLSQAHGGRLVRV